LAKAWEVNKDPVIMSTETLCPGYKQVELFGPDEEYEGEEEVSYVTLDLGASIEPTLVASSSNYRLIVRYSSWSSVDNLRITRTGPRYTYAFLTIIWYDTKRPTRFLDWQRNIFHGR
jgi:hypothetical protein